MIGNHKLCELMWRNYGAYPITLGSERLVPGMLLDWDPGSWLGIWESPKFKGEAGFAWDLLPNDPIKGADYPAEHYKANILAGSVTSKFMIGGSVPLPQYGIKLSGELGAKRKVSLTIGKVTMQSFVNGFSAQRIRYALRQAKGTPEWRWVDDTFLISESYYAGQFHFHFESKVDATFKALIDALNQEITGKYTWESEQDLVMVGDASVPFAVRGLKI